MMYISKIISLRPPHGERDKTGVLVRDSCRFQDLYYAHRFHRLQRLNVHIVINRIENGKNVV